MLTHKPSKAANWSAAVRTVGTSIRTTQLSFLGLRECSHCFGLGALASGSCGSCRGRGVVPVQLPGTGRSLSRSGGLA